MKVFLNDIDRQIKCIYIKDSTGEGCTLSIPEAAQRKLIKVWRVGKHKENRSDPPYSIRIEIDDPNVEIFLRDECPPST